MAKSQYLMLAHTFKPGKDYIGGWFISEKLDGTRCFWDGGVSRGKPTKDVSWANCFKDDRLKVEPIATGLWTRSGKVIHAPDWFLDLLPKKLLLDGELYAGRGGFQLLRKTIANHTPVDEDWENVRYMVFDSPPARVMFKPRDVKVRNDYYFAVKDFNIKELDLISFSENCSFDFTYKYLYANCPANKAVGLLRQEQLPFKQSEAIEQLGMRMEALLDEGAEGVMLRKGTSSWESIRSHNLLKHKPWFTAEGKVIGYQHGQGRLLGMMGALVIDFDGKILKLSGFTDAQRVYKDLESKEEANLYPGQSASVFVSNDLFPLGTIVEFKYRELSDDGIPKEARYFRVIG